MGFVSQAFGLISSTAKNIFNSSGSTTSNRTIEIGTHDLYFKDSVNKIAFGINDSAGTRAFAVSHQDGIFLFFMQNNVDGGSYSSNGNAILNTSIGENAYAFTRRILASDKLQTVIGHSLSGVSNEIVCDQDGITITVGDVISIAGLQTYANNAAAITGGLVVNNLYKTAAGDVKIVV
jgi:hypothetical protein